MFGTKVLEESISKYNGHLRVAKTLGLGTYIQSNGLTQSGGVVESIWRSTLRQIINSKLQITNILILGLGGGTAAKLLRKKFPKAKITGVEIDPVMTTLGKKYLDLENQNIDIKISDAFTYNLSPVRYSLVVVDLYNGDNFPKKFESEKFLKNLSKQKLVVINRLYYKEKKKDSEEFGKKLEKYFLKVTKIYPPSNLMFVCEQ